MFDFEKPRIEIAEISEDKRYGRFVVEPLERGYGTTLGNSLRRIMLSSLPGAAVSQIKIDGVLHEFSSIPGVKEDVTEIIMNIKSLAIKAIMVERHFLEKLDRIIVQVCNIHMRHRNTIPRAPLYGKNHLVQFIVHNLLRR